MKDGSLHAPLVVSREASVPTLDDLRRASRPFLVAAPAVGLILGLAGRLLGFGEAAGWIWAVAAVPAIKIARRSRAIALQSVYAGIGLSIVGMIAAAFGYLAPVRGALI